MRGLKHRDAAVFKLQQGRIFYRCVDWNWKVATKEKETVGRIFYRCVDWNLTFEVKATIIKVASFTDAWIETRALAILPEKVVVASFTDAWIET